MPEPFRCLDCAKRVIPVLPDFACPLCDGFRMVPSNPLGQSSPKQPLLLSSAASANAAEGRGLERFAHRLKHDDIDPDILRETLRMNGVYDDIRQLSWQLLLGHVEPQLALRPVTCKVQRQQYFLLGGKMGLRYRW